MGKVKNAERPTTDAAGQKNKVKLRQQRQQQREQMRWWSLFIAVCVASLAALCGMFYSPPKVVQISLEDSNKLREVLFSGKPWLVHCVNQSSSGPMSALAEETAKLLKPIGEDVRLAAVDCESPLPESGKTLKEKFFKRGNRPEFFLSANGDPPVQVPAAVLSSARKLAEWASGRSKPRLHSITSSTSSLDQTCFKSIARPCFLLLSSSDEPLERKYHWLSKLVREKRHIPIAAVNSTRYRTNFDNSLPSQDLSGATDHPRVVALRRTNGEGGKPEYAGRVWRDEVVGEFGPKSLRSFITSVSDGTTELTHMSKKPAIQSLRPTGDKSKPSSSASASSGKSRDSQPPTKTKKTHDRQSPDTKATERATSDQGPSKKETQQEWELRRRQEMEEQELEDALIWESDDSAEDYDEKIDTEYEDMADYDEDDMIVF